MPLRSSDTPRAASIDLAEMRRRFGGDSELIRDVARAFLDTVPRLRDDIAQANSRDDAAGLARAIHLLRGALLDVAAFRAAELAGRLDPAAQRDTRLELLFTLVDEAANDAAALLGSTERVEEE